MILGGYYFTVIVYYSEESNSVRFLWTAHITEWLQAGMLPSFIKILLRSLGTVTTLYEKEK